jgi:hypothetical protein
MAKNSLNDYSTTPSNNTDIAGTNINVNCPPSDVGIYMRTQMAQLADVIAGNVTLDAWYVADLYVTTLHLTTFAPTNLAPTGYVTVGSPTGGQQGTGSINAEAIYVDGVPVLTSAGSIKYTPTLTWGGGAVVANGTYIFTLYAGAAGTINALSYNVGTAAGSFICNVRINGSSVTGLSAVTVNSGTTASTNATAANTYSAGDKIDVVISSTSGSPTDAALTLRLTE